MGLRKAAPADDYADGDQSAEHYDPEEAMPLFLSDQDEEPEPEEFMPSRRPSRVGSVTAKLLAGVLGISAAAILFAMFSADGTKDLLANVKTSMTAILPGPSSIAAHAATSQLTPTDLRLTESPAPQPQIVENRPPVVKVATVAVTPTAPPPMFAAPAAITPTPEAIKTAYQSALQGGTLKTPEAELVTAANATRRLDPTEVAAAVGRAETLLASGDIAAARLVLRHVAEAGDAHAAMMIASTYDPAMLAKLGVYGVAPDPAAARAWYQKAEKFGAAEATTRLQLLASRQH